MQLSLLVSFIGILVLVVASVQNAVPVELSLFAWTFQTSLNTLIALSGLVGAGAAGALLLPRLVKKHMTMRRLKKDLSREKKRSVLTRPGTGQQPPGAER